LAIVAADTEAAAAEALKAVKVEYEMLDVYVDDEDLAAAEKAGRAQPAGSNTQWEEEPDEDLDDVQAEKEIDRLLKDASVVVEGYYGINVITHMCLEPHG
jgi:CO/xanthine dehydrogenase Mo-binding subunit